MNKFFCSSCGHKNLGYTKPKFCGNCGNTFGVIASATPRKPKPTVSATPKPKPQVYVQPEEYYEEPSDRISLDDLSYEDVTVESRPKQGVTMGQAVCNNPLRPEEVVKRPKGKRMTKKQKQEIVRETLNLGKARGRGESVSVGG